MSKSNSYYTLTKALEEVNEAYNNNLSEVTLTNIRTECSKRIAEHFKDNLIKINTFEDPINKRPCATFFFKPKLVS